MKVGDEMLSKSEKEYKGDLLRKNAIFANMSERTEQRLLDLEEAVFSAGDTVVDAENFATFRGLGILLSGKACVYGKGSNNHVLLNLLKDGDVFGAATVFFSEEEAVSTVLAKTKCRILFIERNTLETIMKDDFAVASAYIAFLSERICFLNRKIISFTAKTADSALANHLLRSADENGELAANMSRIASTLGIGRTTLYRVLDMLKADGSISYDGKKIRILNRELLEQRGRA